MQDNRIQKTTMRGQLIISRVFTAQFQRSNSLTAEFKQTVNEIITYPERTISSNLQDNLYDISEFGLDGKTFNSQRTDVTWIDIPLGETVADVAKRLEKYKDAKLYRVLSNQPIISDLTQVYLETLRQGGEEALAKQHMDRVANSQVMRFLQNAEDGSYNEGDLILDKLGKPQYKACFLDLEGTKDDLDLRTQDEHFYQTMEVFTSLNPTALFTVNQTI